MNQKMQRWRRILAPLYKEKLLVISSICIGGLAAILNLSRPVLLGYIISGLISGTHGDRIGLLVALFTFSWVLTWAASLFIRFLSSVVTQRTLVALQLDLLEHCLNLPVEMSSTIPAGRLEAYTNSDLPLWVTLYGATLAEVVHSCAQLIAAAVALVKLDFHLSVIIAPFLIATALTPLVTSKYMTRVSRRAQDAISGVLERLSTIMNGIPDIVCFGAKSWALGRFRAACTSNYQAQVKRSVAQATINIASSSTEIIAYIVVLAVGGSQVLRHELNVGFLVSYLGTIEMIFFPARYSNDLSSSIQNSWAAAQRIWEFMDLKETRVRVTESAGMRLLSMGYTYPGTNEPALEDITCDLEKGKLIAIIGESGSGKSTLLHVLSGLYQPTAGTIERLDDDKVTAALVRQDSFLFSGTVHDNLALDRDFPLEKIRQIAREINIDETVMRLPSHYQSWVSNSGNNFSGGEKRRLAIVRALLRKPGLLIMDEPTSGLDAENSRLVWEFIERLGSGVTRIITTHRLDEAARADVVLVFKNGQLVECGAPEQISGLLTLMSS